MTNVLMLLDLAARREFEVHATDTLTRQMGPSAFAGLLSTAPSSIKDQSEVCKANDRN